MNARVSGEVRHGDQDKDEILRNRVMLLDGARRFSIQLWEFPCRLDFDQVDVDVYSQEYIQAGGARDRLTVEVRRLEAGTPRHYKVGRGAPNPGADGPQTIDIGGYDFVVRSDEVFTAEEAVPMFIAYRNTGSLPPNYILRPMQI